MAEIGRAHWLISGHQTLQRLLAGCTYEIAFKGEALCKRALAFNQYVAQSTQMTPE